MARKRDPNDVIDAFQHELAKSLALWGEVRAHVGPAGDIAKRIAVDAFTRAAVGFEGFRSDWHIAAINRDSTEFKAFLTAKIERVAVGAYPNIAGKIEVNLPRHPKLEEITELLDPRGRNVSLPDFKAWKERTSEHLVDPWRTQVMSLPTADGRLIDGVVAVRNLLAHESRDASDTMNRALGKLTAGHDPHLRRVGTRRITPSGIGSYLNAIKAGQPRVERYYGRLDEIVEKLRV